MRIQVNLRHQILFETPENDKKSRGAARPPYPHRGGVPPPSAPISLVSGRFREYPQNPRQLSVIPGLLALKKFL